MTSLKKKARLTGLLYLIVIICAGFAEGYVRASLLVPGDAAATAANIVASEGLFRLGFALDLVAFLGDVGISILLYKLLKPAGKTLAMIMAALRLLAHPAIATVNMLNHFSVLLMLGEADYLTVFDPQQLEALVLFFLEAHHTGYLIAGAFFGPHLLLLGYLLRRSKLFPSLLGILLMMAGVGYLIESFGNFLFPGHEAIFLWIVSVTAVIGELSFTLWLLIKGIRNKDAYTIP